MVVGTSMGRVLRGYRRSRQGRPIIAPRERPPHFQRRHLSYPCLPRTLSDARAIGGRQGRSRCRFSCLASTLTASMTRVLFTEQDYPDVKLERGVLEAAGIELILGNCKTEDALIAAGKDVDALLIQYAPVTERVIAELPQLGLVSRIGAGFDTVDIAAGT